MFMQTQTAFNTANSIDLDALFKRAMVQASGLLAGTRIETATGWRSVETLAVGDEVYTLDGGLRRITGLRRTNVTPHRLLHVPGGALDNCAAMTLLPAQRMLLESSAAGEVFGTPYALVPSAALAGHCGINWIGGQDCELTTPCFDQEEIVWGNSGALFHCPAKGQDDAAPFTSDFFTSLDIVQARAMLELMSDPQEPFALAA